MSQRRIDRYHSGAEAMTTNQTIDGVPRDLLQKIADGGYCHQGLMDRLRALLDAPAPVWNPHPDVANLAALLITLAQHGIKVKGGNGDQPWSIEPSAQPQGVPMYQVQYNGGYAGWRDVDAETYTELKDDKRYISRIVYAEQPAPVAVVLPERLPGDDGVCTESHYASGWNTCLDEVTRLNAKPDRSTSVLHP